MKLYGYTEVRKMNSDDLRNLCIREHWYTEGNCEEYTNLLSKADDIDNVTTDDIVEIATDIYSHSRFEDDYTMNELILNIMFKVGKICITLFEED